MEIFPHTDRLENLHPFRLLLRFILLSVILILVFLFISYLILKRNGDDNLNIYFNSLYMHTKNASERFIEDNINSMKTIAGFEPVHKFFKDFEIKANYVESSTGEPIFFSEMPIPIKLISRDGFFVIAGVDRGPLVSYPDFDKIRTMVDQGHTAGHFIVVNHQTPAFGRGPDSTIAVIFVQVTDSEKEVLGYLVNEVNLEMLGLNMQDPGIADIGSDEGFYTIYKKLDFYFIDEYGRPITKLLYAAEYQNKLISAGVGSNYHDLPIYNPSSPTSLNGESNIFLIKQLINDHPGELVRNLKPYKNYSGLRVEGGVFWLESLNAGVVMELDASAAFSPYVYTMSIILLILILSFIVFLYLILWINKLRMRALNANPLTKLPGNTEINSRLQSLIDKRQAVTVVYADLDNFKAYNDLYGFSMGDEVIKFTADLLKSYIGGFPSKLSFCGHIGGDDFIFVIPETHAEETSSLIAEQFDAGIRKFYKAGHLENGYIEEKNREGVMQRFPLIGLSMAGVELSKISFKHYLEVSNRCGELKKLAKKQVGSCFVMERRHL